ncbi:MAG TPA: manganese efflux pump MntP [Rhodospirillaceae bacterium]|nr:manganese efflux pump MntP [Rhodospirillaceae bacterium]
MSIFAVLTIALGLSADAFAVSLCRGAGGRFRTFGSAARMGLLFGASEAGMTLLGYLLASRFAEQVQDLDHWIALILLGGVGGHMLWEAFFGEDEADCEDEEPRKRSILGNIATVIGTSIDSAAVGVAFSVIAVDIVTAVCVIGLMSFSISTLGLMIAPRVGGYLGRWAEVAGGLVLIGIGSYIFYSHTMGAGAGA